MLIALLTSLQNKDRKIEIPVTKNGDYLEMKPWPETFWSEYGYKDPSSSMNENDVEYLPEEELAE